MSKFGLKTIQNMSEKRFSTVQMLTKFDTEQLKDLEKIIDTISDEELQEVVECPWLTHCSWVNTNTRGFHVYAEVCRHCIEVDQHLQYYKNIMPKASKLEKTKVSPRHLRACRRTLYSLRSQIG